MSGALTVTALAEGTDGNLITPDSTLPLSGGFTLGSPLKGGAGQASIIAFNNLYSTQGSAGGYCDSNGPSVYWSYQTSTLATKGAVVTSPVISGDGSKIAYVETSSSGAVLHLLQWKAGEGTGPGAGAVPATTLTVGTQDWSNCPPGTSCIFNIPFNGGAQDTNSSPFYDYNADALYVGDNAGKLHKFINVFLGSKSSTRPAEVIGTGWPITVHGAALSSPVKDNISGNIFVGDNSGTLSYVKEVGSSTGTCSGGGNATPCLGQTLGASGSGTTTTINVSTGASNVANGAFASGAVVDGPIVDGSNGTVYVVNGSEGGTNSGTLIETNTALGSAVVGDVIANLKIGGEGGGIARSYIHSGAFDNAYLTSAGGTGFMYVCGKDQASIDQPAIYHLSITAGVASTTVGTQLTHLVSANGFACSPVTEVENTASSTEWIFFSIAGSATSIDPIPAASACRTDNNGCLISINVTTYTTAALWNTFATAASTGGTASVTAAISLPAGAATGPNGGDIDATSGIIVDNIANTTTYPQSSSIYFTLSGNSASGTGIPGLPQCNGLNGVGCAAKLTQAAFQ